MKKTTKITKRKSAKIDLPIEKMIENIIEGKETLKVRKGIKIFSQGADADAVYFIRSGTVKMSIAWRKVGDGALAILGPGDFFGEGCLVGQSLRINTATAIESAVVVKIQRRAMLQALQTQSEISETFIAAILIRNIDVEKDICNQLFNNVEKRLAHVLLKLNRYGRPDYLPDGRFSQLSHETLADLVGTTRLQILHFLEKFRGLGLISYNGKGEIKVRAEMLADLVLAV